MQAARADQVRPVVVTSLNPFAKLPAQLECWRAWEALGLEVRTANVAAEAERLIAAGIPADAVLPVTEAASGRALFGKPTPRIAPLLADVALRFADRPILLTNSDIYPAATHADVMGIYLAQAPLAALVREETATHESASFARRAPYRGGLDSFLMTGPMLAAVNEALAGIEAVERMAFGVPGWDYLMGALFLSLGGVVMDSGLLLHESHETTYANVDEFLAYVPAMQALNAAKGPSAAEAAFQFYHRIEHECRMSAAASRLAKLKYFRQPTAQTSPRARTVTARFLDAFPFAAATTNFAVLAALADDIAGARRPDMERALNVFDTGAGVDAAFREALLATVFALMVREGIDGPPRAPRPADRRHRLAVAALSQAGERTEAEERLAVARLVAVERVEHGIANVALAEYLVLAARNDAERTLAMMIHPAPEGTRDAA